MSLTTAIAEKSIPLVRDFARWFLWDRVSQRCRSWTVLEWFKPYDAVIQFGEQAITSMLVEAHAKRYATIRYPSTEEEMRQYEQIKLDITTATEVLVENLTALLLDGTLVAKGHRCPMVHGAPYLPIARSEWLILQLDINSSSAEGEGIKYVAMTIGKAGTKRFFRRCRTSIS